MSAAPKYFIDIGSGFMDMLSPFHVILPFFKVLDSLHLKRTLSQRHHVSKKMCIFAAEIDARKVEQCGKHLYCPSCKFANFIPRDMILMPFCFSCMYWHFAFAYRKHRIRFSSFYLGKGVWRFPQFVETATRVLCFHCNVSLLPYGGLWAEKQFCHGF